LGIGVSDSEKTILLGMPGCGTQTAAAGQGFWCACRDMRPVINIYEPGSLLAVNFNKLWCAALNRVHGGQPLKYFAMLHSDVGPISEYWLDMLIAELEARQLDVLGVVVPIKDCRGLTSLALHRAGNNWRRLARLSMRDVFQLPETFTSQDVGAPLLLNTGCWVCKWDQEWCRKVHFEINDRIVFNMPANQYQAEVEPEDWFFSRQCHELRLKIGATRKVAVEHSGEAKYLNSRPWGTWHYDRELVRTSPIPLAFPTDVMGWLAPEEGAALAELARGRQVLEIGSFMGLSAVCLARTAASLTCVDFFDRRVEVGEFSGPLGEAFDRSLEQYGVAGKVTKCHPAAELPLAAYELVYIDGDHAADSVRADISKALEVLADGGLIAFHDYRRPIDPGVTEAVDEFLASGAELVSLTKTLAVVKPPAAIPLEV
jgi:hypothetical protein